MRTRAEELVRRGGTDSAPVQPVQPVQLLQPAPPDGAQQRRGSRSPLGTGCQGLGAAAREVRGSERRAISTVAVHPSARR